MKATFSKYIHACENVGCILMLSFQRIGNSLRQGGPHCIQLQCFEEALHGTTAGLTYCALGNRVWRMLRDCLVFL